MKLLHIDIVSDIVCPWCVVGYRQLNMALLEKNIPHTIHWHPFELNPDMLCEGENLREHIIRKYGITEQESEANRQRLTSLGDSLGFKFAFDDSTRIYPTHRAHQLLAWVRQLEPQSDSVLSDNAKAGSDSTPQLDIEHQLKLALFEAYFSNQKNINDIDVLVSLTAQLGLSASDARKALDTEKFANAVRKHEQVWTAQGVKGVPAMIFNQKYLVSGAQGVENYQNILRQVESE